MAGQWRASRSEGVGWLLRGKRKKAQEAPVHRSSHFQPQASNTTLLPRCTHPPCAHDTATALFPSPLRSPVPLVDPMLPNTMACTVTPVPYRHASMQGKPGRAAWPGLKW